ncbi:MAG: hypothetical protein AAF900_00615 [Bacteroidota bacterium]
METKLINVIAEEYLRSFKQEQDGIKEMDEKVVVPSKKKKKWVSKVLMPRATAILTFAQLEGSKLLEESLAQSKNTLDFYSWQDLDLLCGNQATPDKNLHAKIDRTVTTLGKCVLATKLVSPSTAQEEIVKKQQIIKVLYEDAELRKNLGAELSRIKEDEAKRASLWSKSSPLKQDKYTGELQALFYRLYFFKRKEGSGLTIWTPSATSASKLQWLKRITDFFSIYFYSLFALGYNFFLYRMRRWLLGASVYDNIFIVLGILGCLFMLFTGPVRYYRMKKPVISFLAEHMATLQTFVKSAYKINTIVMSHPKLKELYKDELKAVRYLWDMGKKKSDLGRMICALQGPSWKNWGYFMSPTGQLLAAYTIFEKRKRVFANAFYEIGKLDVHFSTASLIQETEGDQLENRYVFSDVLSPKAKDDVVVKGERIWHPCLAREAAVSNDLSLDSQKGNRLIVITGANMGGKSTYILSSGLGVLLSQCFGIAPAKSFSHTCFKKFITYVNPSQNLARGLSLAGAAFEVLKTHKKALDATDGPVFAIIDEILNGVDAKMGLDVSRDILESRYKKYPNCVTLLTTHYMKLSELDRLPGVANKHVEAIVVAKGMPIKFTYKILDGASKQNIVKEIVFNMGILDEIK